MNSLRRVNIIRVIITVTVLAVALLMHHSSQHGEGWLFLSAFLVLQTTIGTPIKQGLLILIMIGITVIFSVTLNQYINDKFSVQTIVYCIAASVLFFHFVFFDRKGLFGLCFIAILLMINLFSIPSKINLLYVLGGGALGLMANEVIAKTSTVPMFNHSMQIFLQQLAKYTEDLRLYFINNESPPNSYSLEKLLSSHSTQFPHWVFELGFNPGLRGGYRFFLVQVERVAELLTALNYVLIQSKDVALLQSLSNEISISLHANQNILLMLENYFKSQIIQDEQADYVSDIEVLDQALQQLIPSSIELIDIAEANIILANVVRNIKDTREILLALLAALPASTTVIKTAS